MDQVLKALGHPLRRRILTALAEEARSAKGLSREFKMELSSVAYHLNHVLNRECEILELVEAVPKRGALEKFYRIDADALREGATGSAEKGMTAEECILALAIGVADLPGNCSRVLPS